MASNVSYEVKVVARAVDIPVRRLEGWVERRLVVPTVPAKGTGSRARFSQEDVLRVAIIAEIQRLFGTDFRPGSIAAKLGGDPLNLAHLDTVMRGAVHDDSDEKRRSGARGDAKAKLRLYVYHGTHGLSIGATGKPPDEVLKTKPVVLFIDPMPVWRRIRSRLED
jgi:hypothetical protein